MVQTFVHERERGGGGVVCNQPVSTAAPVRPTKFATALVIARRSSDMQDSHMFRPMPTVGTRCIWYVLHLVFLACMLVSMLSKYFTFNKRTSCGNEIQGVGCAGRV